MEATVAGSAAALTSVALVASPKARESGWAPRAAVQLATSWPRRRPVVLMDLGLADPSLHEAAGVANDEGLRDVVDFGLTLGRVAVRPGGRSFDVVAAGAYSPDPEALLRSPEWTRIIAELTARRSTLLAYVPSDAAGAAAVIERAGAVIVLAQDAAEGRRVATALPHPFAVLAVLTAPEAAPEVLVPRSAPKLADFDAVRMSDDDFDRIRLPSGPSREALIADLRARQRAARLAPASESDRILRAPPMAPGDPDEPAQSPARPVLFPLPPLPSLDDDSDAAELEMLPPQPASQRTWSRQPIVASIAAVLLLSAIAGIWKFRGARANGNAAPVAARPESAAIAPIPVPPVERPLPFVVAVEAHRDLETALTRVAALRAAEPAFTFHVAPLEREGMLFYHVMGGPLPDSTGALALRDTLVAHGRKLAPSPNDVRASPLAFRIGDYTTAGEAAEMVSELRRLDVPGYVVPRAGFPQPHRVYVGSFAAPAEAEVVRRLLRAAGVTDSLITRTGSRTR